MNSRSENNMPKNVTGKADAAVPRNDGRTAVSVDSPIFKDVQVTLNATLGRTALTVQDILALKSGTIVKLDARLNDLAELRLNDSLVARGEIVAVDGSFAIKIVEIAQLS